MPKSQNLPPRASSTLTVSAEDCNRIETLFLRFNAIYGHVWRSQFKSEDFLAFAKQEWQEGLSGFSDKLLSQAVIHCRETYDMPPTLAQIIGYCRQMMKRHEMFQAETSLPADRQVVQLHLQQCKAFLIKK